MGLIHRTQITFEDRGCLIIEKSGSHYLKVDDQLRLIKEHREDVHLRGTEWSVSCLEFISDMQQAQQNLIDVHGAVKELGMDIVMGSYEGSYDIQTSMTYYTVESKKSYLGRIARNSKIAKSQKTIARERKLKAEEKERAEFERLKKKFG